MKRLIICFSLILFPIFGTTQDFKKKNSVKEQQEDFNIFKTTLLECHVGVFDYNDSLSLKSALMQLENKLNYRPLMLIEQLSLYSKFISRINCIHTYAYHKKLTPQSLKAKFKLPFSVCFSNNQLRLTESHQFEIDKRDQILTINNESVNSIKDSLYQFISSDGNNTTRKDEVLKHHFLYYYFLYQQMETNLMLKYIHNGDTIIRMFPLYNNHIKKKKRKTNKSISYSIDTRTNYAFLTLPSPLPMDKKYKKELHTFITKINNLMIQNLIVDLRNNGGGKSQQYFAGFFINSTIVYGYKHHTSIHDATYKKHFINKVNLQFLISNFIGRFSQKEIKSYVIPQSQYNGQLFILINGNTASAASNLASILKEWGNAVVVGTESGGGYKSYNTGGLILQLPNSKIRIRIRNIKGYNNTRNHYNSDGVSPNYPIEEHNPFNTKGDSQLDYIIDELILTKPKLH